MAAKERRGFKMQLFDFSLSAMFSHDSLKSKSNYNYLCCYFVEPCVNLLKPKQQRLRALHLEIGIPRAPWLSVSDSQRTPHGAIWHSFGIYSVGNPWTTHGLSAASLRLQIKEPHWLSYRKGGNEIRQCWGAVFVARRGITNFRIHVFQHA